MPSPLVYMFASAYTMWFFSVDHRNDPLFMNHRRSHAAFLILMNLYAAGGLELLDKQGNDPMWYFIATRLGALTLVLLGYAALFKVSSLADNRRSQAQQAIAAEQAAPAQQAAPVANTNNANGGQ